MTLGQRIQELRKKANLSQGDLASKVDISYPQTDFRFARKEAYSIIGTLKEFCLLFLNKRLLK